MTADVTCRIAVGANKVRLDIDDNVFEAPIKRDALDESIVRRLDRFVSCHPTDDDLGYERDDLALLGTILFRILFGGPASQLIVSATGSKKLVKLDGVLGARLVDHLDKFAQRDSAAPPAKFRISLTFDDDASSLATYPWEFLYVDRAGEGFFLGQRATLIRVVSPMLKVGPSHSLRVAVAWADPRELGPLHGADKMAGAIRQILDGRVAAEVESLDHCTWQQLSTYLRSGSPDVLHIIAHGRLTEQGGQLAFLRTPQEMDAERARVALSGLGRGEDVCQANWVAVSDLAALLEEQPARLVFLHACNSGRARPGVEAFRGAANRIARAGVPFVVAMQYEIANDDADIFALEFYKTIASPDASVDDAVRAGRSSLGTKSPAWSHRRFATPVVYLHNEITRLVAPKVEFDGPTDTPLTVALQTCPFDDCARKIKTEGKFCSCPRRNRFILCDEGHANTPDSEECWIRECRAPPLRPGAAAAPMARSITQAGET